MLDPESVCPPEWEDIVLLYNDGYFSVITGHYAGGTTPTYGVRWNGTPENDKDIGHPNAFGYPEWFVIPSCIAEPILHTLLTESFNRPEMEHFSQSILDAIQKEARRISPNSLQYAIALYGASNTGKTMTLNALIDILAAESVKEGHGGILVEENISYDSDSKVGDRCVAIRVFKKLVAVATGGDDDFAVERGIAFAHKFNADVLVIATRKRSDSRSWSEFWEEIVANYAIPYQAVEKVWDSNQKNAAKSALINAQHLLDLIRRT